jgi:segregation and condensation protein A
MSQANYTIKLPVFEGPFDLLFHLIKKAEVDIWAVSIAEITGQYLAYLQSMKELNLDIASEFLVMAATLLRLKSKLLLPRPPRPESGESEDEIFAINSPEELFSRLEEYRRFKEASLFLKERERRQQKIYLRATGGRKVLLVQEQQSYYTFWEGAGLLGEIMRRFVEAAAAVELRPVLTTLDDFMVMEKAEFIYGILERAARALPLTAFLREKGLWELIVTFIALLELARQRRILLLQDRPFGPILVSLTSLAVKEQPNGA